MFTPIEHRAWGEEPEPEWWMTWPIRLVAVLAARHEKRK